MAKGGRVLSDQLRYLLSLPAGLMIIKSGLLVVCVLVIVTVLIRNRSEEKRLRRMETELKKLQDEIDFLRIRESRRLLMEVNANSRVVPITPVAADRLPPSSEEPGGGIEPAQPAIRL